MLQEVEKAMISRVASSAAGFTDRNTTNTKGGIICLYSLVTHTDVPNLLLLSSLKLVSKVKFVQQSMFSQLEISTALHPL